MSRISEIEAKLADYDAKMASPEEEYGLWSQRLRAGMFAEDVRVRRGRRRQAVLFLLAIRKIGTGKAVLQALREGQLEMTAYQALRFAAIRQVAFAPRLSGVDITMLEQLTTYGWLQRLDKANGRCAYQITDLGKEVWGLVDWLEYQMALFPNQEINLAMQSVT